MSGFREKDFIKRLIQQFALALAKALKLRREQKFDEARQTLGEAFDDLVGVPRSLIDRLDVASAAQLIGDAEKLRIWARLLKEEAAINDDEGLDSTELLDRAKLVLAEAIARSSETSDDRTLLAGLDAQAR